MPPKKHLPSTGSPESPPKRGGPSAATPPSPSEKVGLYQLLIETVRDYAIFALDANGYVLTWNAGAERLKGYLPDEIIGQHFSIFYPRELVLEGFPDFELRTAANTGRFEDEGWRIRKDGTRFWANVIITALRDRHTGELVGFAKVTRDLTERREAEEALRESEERFRLLIESVREYAIFMLDPTGRVATWNDGAERIKQYRAKEIIGQPFSKFFPPEDLAAGKPQHELEVATQVGKYEDEGWRLRKDGSRFWANVVITAVRNKTGELVGFAKIIRDLTERRAAEQRALQDARRVAAEEAARHEAEIREEEMRRLAAQLKAQTEQLATRSREADEARKRADEANRVKSQFLAAMSHELRTPLNAIGGYTDLIAMGLSGPVTDQQSEQLQRIKRSQEHLLGIINDILNFSRIEAGQLTYDIGPVPMAKVVESVTHMILPQAHAKSIALEVHDCADDVVAEADRAKVEQIVLNLVSNAVKFTAAGGFIHVNCRIADGKVTLMVRDTGCGIPPDKLDAIFEPFVQVGRTLTSTREGAGLGLAISRDLARAMGGDITVRSAVDLGSEFCLALPEHRWTRKDRAAR